MTSQVDAPIKPFDLVELPGVGRFLRWRHSRTALQLPLFLVAGLMIFDGLVGPQLAPKNLATVLTWVHYRGLVVLALLLAGNLFCMACPFMLVRNLVRRFHKPQRMWPQRLRNKWLALGLFVLMLFAYELLDLWAAPRLTAWLIVAYFGASLLVDSLFRGATFCKYLCPLGHFNFVASLISPLEVKVRGPHPCATCHTKDCIKGNPQSPIADPRQPGRGCELWLFQPRKFGNMDCTFCLDCVHACPHDNIGVSGRLPASELWDDRRRSGIGHFSRRSDLAALATVFCFGALLNAFAMVTPVYALEEWLADLMGTSAELPVLATIFFVGLGVVPLVLLGLAAWLSRWLAGAGTTPQTGIWAWMTRYAYALVPVGFGVWLAHYAFHFLTGFWTFVPVIQSFFADMAGLPLLGVPHWGLGPVVPAGWLYPLELGFLGLGWFGSLLVAYQLAAQEDGPNGWRAVAPWALLVTFIFAAAVWLMAQPMEMRGTFLAG